MSYQQKPKNMSKKIGLMGGTFDPIHIGHINLAKSASQIYNLDEVWFIPTGISYLKKDRNVTDASTRLEMTRLAIEDINDCSVTDFEIKRQGFTYTFETLIELRKEYPGYEFYFIMGRDSLLYFDKWYMPEKILENAIVLAGTREGSSVDELLNKAEYCMEQLGGKISVFEFEDIPYSSTKIRELCKQLSSTNFNNLEKEKTLDLLIKAVPTKTLDYILEKGIYSKV